MSFTIDPQLLTPLAPRERSDWKLWQKKNLNLHRGLIELTAPRVASIHDLAADIRAGVRTEFRPGWLRGFGFGAIIHFREVPADFSQICDHVDRRNRSGGVWQWAIACFDEDRLAVAIHTWLHGYLRPVYDSALEQLSAQGYQCHAVDAEIDALIARLQQIARTGRAIQSLGGLMG